MIVFRIGKRNRYSITVLSAALESRGLKYEIASSLEEVLSFDPSSTTVAYSLMTFDVPEVEEEVRILKSRGYILIAGGPHPTADKEKSGSRRLSTFQPLERYVHAHRDIEGLSFQVWILLHPGHRRGEDEVQIR